MKTLGVDQSYTSTGWCLNHNGTMTHFGTIKTTGDDMYSRAVQVADGIVDIIKHHKVDVVNCEGLAYGSVGDATRNLAGLAFVLITTLRRMCPTVIVNIVPPTTLKKHATQKGNASKQEMVDALPSNVRDRIIVAGYKKTTGLYDITDAHFLSTYPT